VAGAALTELSSAERRYGGPLRFRESESPHLVTNFVGTIDGVVSLGTEDRNDSSVISAHSAADRYVMAMLRAAADVILIGARTLEEAPGHQWTAEKLVPSEVRPLQDYRRALGRTTDAAPLAIVSGSGRLADHVALTNPAVPTTVFTTNAAAPIRMEFPKVNRIVVPGAGRMDGDTLMQALVDAYNPRLVLCEGGAQLLGTLVAANQVSEMFLTVAPRIAGRDGSQQRLGMVEGFAADPHELQEYALLSVRREAATLLLRYARA
jgi:riboflavin biosynthesis pyrimidine reductase